MGWTSTWDTSKSAMRHALDEWDGDLNFSVIKSSGKYHAILDNRTGQRFAVVILTSSTKSERAWKQIPETMGPTEAACPESILRLLSPPENDHAAEWRERCRAYNSKPDVNVGDTIELAKPITFSDGVERSRFTRVKGSRFRGEDGQLVQLGRDWRHRNFTLVTPGLVASHME